MAAGRTNGHDSMVAGGNLVPGALQHEQVAQIASRLLANRHRSAISDHDTVAAVARRCFLLLLLVCLGCHGCFLPSENLSPAIVDDVFDEGV